MSASLGLSVPIFVVLLVLAVACAVMARGGWTGSARRTGPLGVHTPAASASDDAFALANKVAAPVFGGAALVALVAAVLVLALRLPTSAVIVVLVVGLIGVLGLLTGGALLGDKAARTVPIPARKPAASGAGCGGCACGSGGCAGLTRTTPATENAVG